MSSYDLFLTNTGDLSFSIVDYTARNDIFDFNFYIAPSQALLFNFMIDNNTATVYDNKKKLRADVYVNDFDEIDSIESLKEGMKVYVARTDTVYKIVPSTGISLPIEPEEEVILNMGIQPLEFSSNFDFEFYIHKPKDDKRNIMVQNLSYIEQAIRIRLDSESGSVLGNESLGADLFKLMHSDMQASKLLNKISAQVKNAISDILPNCTVKAYTINSDYFNYHNTIKIVIINNEEVYYYYV